ncbi:SDR family oxidoreductase [Microlunatus parietis]
MTQTSPPAAAELAPLAVVTGGSRGIGAATAERLARDGYCVAVHYGSDAAAADTVVARIRRNGGDAFSFRAELNRPEAGHRFWEAYDAAAGDRRGQRLRTMINNAGVTLRGPIEDFTSESLLQQQQINQVAPFLIVQAGLDRLEDGGRIVNVSSGATRIATPDIIGYTMTKSAIDAFTRILAQHLGHRRITVNAVAPGIIDTDMNAGWLRGNPEAVEQVLPQIALGRIGTAAEIADVISFLASDDARYVTGHTIDATGGSRL